MDKISYWLYFGVSVWNILLVIAATIFCIMLYNCLSDSNDDRECYEYTDLGTVLNGVCFALLSVLLICTVIPLFSALNRL